MPQEQAEPSLFDQANILSKITFWWLTPLFRKSPGHVARVCGQYDVPASDEADLLERRLDRLWKKEVRKYSEGSESSLRKAILAAFLLQWILPGILLLLAETARLTQPSLLGMLVAYIAGESQATKTVVYLHGFGLGLMLFLHITLGAVYVFLTHRVALKMKTALEALVYRKVMSLSCEAVLQTSSDLIICQLSNTEIFTGAIEHFHYLWVSPLQLVVVIFLLIRELGTAGLVCLVVVVAVVTLQAVLEPVAAKLRDHSEILREQRCQVTHRILVAMLQVKVFCLETTLTPLMTSLRKREIPWLRGSATLHGILYCFLGVTCRLMLLLAVSIVTKTELSLQALFTVFALLDVLSWCLYRFPVRGIRDWLALCSALRSVQTFLLLDEEKEQIKDLRLQRSVSYRNEPYADWVIDIDHMTARWRTVHTGERKKFQKRRIRDSTSSTKSLLHESDAEHAFSLKYLSLQVKKGELIAVIGAPHSGKTSLLMTLIGELPYEIGQISVNGRVAFCGQTPWLYSASVRDNILFGDSYDARRYENVVRVCSLSRLFEILPDGDDTEVGERGLQLSGSYAARITLARAVYNNADIYLLDDILSCMDNSTKQELFRGCVSGMLSGKTRVMVTQNWQCLRTADRIAVLREGSLVDVGSLEELQGRGVDVREFVNSDPGQRRAQVEAEEEHFHVRLKIMRKTSEERKERWRHVRSDVSTFFTFLTQSRVWIAIPLITLLWIGSQALTSASDWMLASWIAEVGTASNTSSASAASSPNQPVTYVYQPTSSASPPLVGLPAQTSTSAPSSSSRLLDLYIILLGSAIGVSLLCAVVVTQVCVTAAQALHDKMVSVVMRAESNFFSLTPVGDIVSAFSQHLWFIDTHVPQLTYLSTEMTLRVIAMAVMMCVVSPWLVLPVLLLIVVMATLQVMSGRVLQGIRIFRELARSPVYTDIAETLKGLGTIRAYKRNEHFLQGFDTHLNSLTWARFLGLCAYSHLSLLSLLLTIVFSSVVVYVSISLAGSVHSGLLGLVLTYCVTLVLPLHALLQHSVGLSDQMASVHRAVSLAQQDQEPAWSSDKPPPSDWPNRGTITFSRVNLMVGPNGPYVIRDLDVHVKSKEKVGVVGEVGSGKYSLVSVLMRLQHVQGMIFIDGFDVLKIGLHELRKNILVVPQEPVLFPGTLRTNLDPEGEFDDEQLWSALDKMGLRDKVAGVRGGLSVDVNSDAATFSLGQRQLICMARGVLKKTKIILFEEAMDPIDKDLTDHIQRMLRAKFRDCTILMVGHRLASVMDCDRIMVFHGGEACEFDTPYTLLQQSNGYFTRLVEQGGKRQAQQLRAMAELSQQQRASASLMLEHAVFMATEQLHASTEDLTFKPGSLAWSHMARFSKSQDSLEKAHSDWGSRGDVREDADLAPPAPKGRQVPSLAPAQRIINRRKSPNRGKRLGGGGQDDGRDRDVEDGERSRTDSEQMALLSYDTPPRAPAQRGSYEKKGSNDRDSNGRSNSRIGEKPNNQVDTSPLLDYNSSPKPRVRSPTSRNSPVGFTSTPASHGAVGKRILETAIDTPPSGRRTFTPSSNDRSSRSPAGQGRVAAARGNTPGRVVFSREPRGRIISGEYSPPAQDDREDTEKIIYC